MRFGLRHLRYFIAVAEELHFRRASERLGIAQPALSRTIQDLENDLGVRLLYRSNRRVELTKSGQAFLDSSHNILNVVNGAVENARSIGEGNLGALRVGYTDIAIAGGLPKFFRAFQQNHQDIRLRLNLAVSTLQLAQLESHALDIGFITGPPQTPGIRYVSIDQEKFICIVYDGHHLANHTSIPLAELANEDFIQGTEAAWQIFLSHLLPLFRQRGFSPRIVQEIDTTAGILSLVSAGVGIAILPHSVEKNLPSGLKALPLSDLEHTIETVAVWKEDEAHELKARFIKELRLWKSKN